MQHTTDDYLDFAIQLAHHSGKIMRGAFGFNTKDERKDDNTHVTQADNQINDYVIKQIHNKYPDHSVLGEEQSHIQSSAYVWVCDPIDGTSSFAFGLATNVFILVLVISGIPEIGVVYDPHLDRTFTSVRGQGAYLNNTEKLGVNNQSLAVAFFGCSGKRSKIVDTPKLHADIERLSHRMLVLSCVGYESMLTASGKLAGHVYSGSNVYDGVAAALFVKEAGGVVTDLYGEEQRYDRSIKAS